MKCLLFILLVCGLFIFNNSSTYINEDQLILNSKLINYKSISIDGNEELISFVNENNIPGTGSKSNPFIIDNFTGFNDLEIYLKSTSLYVSIQNSIFIENKSYSFIGIKLYKAYNIALKNNSFSGLGIGVSIVDSSFITVENNFFTNVTDSIFVSISKNVTINSVFVEKSVHNGIRFENSENVTLKNSISHNNVASGLRVIDSSDVLIQNNSIFNNGFNFEFLSSTGTIDDNQIYNSTGTNLYITSSSSLIISNNKIFNSSISGLSISSSFYLEIKNNSIFDNNLNGLSISNSYSSTIRNNLFGKNNYSSLKISLSSYITIEANNFENHSLYALEIDMFSNDININKNNFILYANTNTSQIKDFGSNNNYESNYFSDWLNRNEPYSIEGQTVIKTNTKETSILTTFNKNSSNEFSSQFISWELYPLFLLIVILGFMKCYSRRVDKK